ncbi:4'-phosphopantetheinyl transferase family protein [Arthrobacter sp. HY1533]|uniref:4'-phosphopantetheinyl transferase family protein n=1 Tax=Arthrobacter sp. HY1533 TaxID=2970919 RepID=UPI0022B9DFD2|nr:4'-phosphopantetheinyl transferase family protein [Arthrobacter sp. HY1533]
MVNGASAAGPIVRAFDLAAVGQDLAPLLDPAEHGRANTIADTATRREFLAGRIAQRLAAAELLGCEPAALETAYVCPDCGSGPDLAHGRPGYRLRGGAGGVSLSLSRSSGWAVMAMLPAHGLRLGVDIQHIASVGFPGFDGVALSPAEQRRLGGLPPALRDAWRADAWARKEALAKHSGQGLRTDPATIPAFSDGAADGPWAGVVVRSMGPGELGLPDGFAVALAHGGRSGGL